MKIWCWLFNHKWVDISERPDFAARKREFNKKDLEIFSNIQACQRCSEVQRKGHRKLVNFTNGE